MYLSTKIMDNGNEEWKFHPRRVAIEVRCMRSSMTLENRLEAPETPIIRTQWEQKEKEKNSRYYLSGNWQNPLRTCRCVLWTRSQDWYSVGEFCFYPA